MLEMRDNRQPSLLFSWLNKEKTDKETAGKNLVRKLQDVRKGMTLAEQENFDALLAKIVKEIKYQSSLSNEREKELVLFFIENSCSHTRSELSDDTHFPVEKVKDILQQLFSEGLIETVKGYAVGGSSMPSIIISKRNPCSCKLKYAKMVQGRI